MKRLVVLALALFGVFNAVAGAVVVKKGDTLSGLFGARATEKCQLNKLADCNRIYVGQVLRTSAETVQAPADASCIKLNVDPYNRYFEVNVERTLRGIDALTSLTPEQKVKAKRLVSSGIRPIPTLIQNQIFREMLSGAGDKVKHVYGKRVCSPAEGGRPEAMYVYDLGDGSAFALPIGCGNGSVTDVLIRRREEPPVTSPPAIPASAPPTQPAAPAPAPQPTAPAPAPAPVTSAPPPAAPAAIAYEHQVDAYTGYGRVWHGDSHYGYAGFDWYLRQWVLVDADGKTHRLGFGADYASGSGQVTPDGNFKWDALTLRPVAYKIEGTDGKTLRLRFLVTRVRDGVVADAGRYENDRKLWYWGPEVIFTDRGRKDAGEKWWSEHRFSAALLFAFKKSGSHSWEGQPITETTELLKVQGMLRAGARLYVYDTEHGFRTFVQAGLSVQWPNVARSVGLSVGVESDDELWTAFVGPNFDLKEGTWSFGAEVSLQIGRAYLIYRGLAAQTGIQAAVECVEREGGFAYFSATSLPVSGTCPKDAATGTSQPQQPPQSD